MRANHTQQFNIPFQIRNNNQTITNDLQNINASLNNQRFNSNMFNYNYNNQNPMSNISILTPSHTLLNSHLSDSIIFHQANNTNNTNTTTDNQFSNVTPLTPNNTFQQLNPYHNHNNINNNNFSFNGNITNIAYTQQTSTNDQQPPVILTPEPTVLNPILNNVIFKLLFKQYKIYII
jgi:hypothetical protein